MRAKLNLVAGIIPGIFKVSTEVESSLKKLAEKKITKETPEYEVVDDLNNLIQSVSQDTQFQNVIFIIEDIDRFAGLDKPGEKAEKFLNYVFPVFEELESSLFITFADTSRTEIKFLINKHFQGEMKLPKKVTKDFIKESLDLKLKAASNKMMEVERVFDSSALEYFYKKNSDEDFPYRAIVQVLNELHNQGKIPPSTPITEEELKSFEDDGLIFRK